MFKIDILNSDWNGFGQAADYLELDAAIDVSLTGDLRIYLRGQSETFKDIWLPWVSSGLAAALSEIQRQPKRVVSKHVLIPDYDFHVQLKTSGTQIRVSFIGGRMKPIRIATLPTAMVAREIGIFNRQVLTRIEAKEPKLRAHLRTRKV